MNTEQLKAAIPTADHLQTLGPFQKKKAVEDAVEVVLTAIESERALPDLWETDHLLLAMGAVLRGQYHLAAANLELALEPPEGRSPQATLEQTEPWAFHRLRSTLATLRALPAF